jgi:(p)ppGpp synthase/HD superfamily hydrolase
MVNFDAKRAEKLLRKVFLTKEIMTALNVNENEINDVVNADVIKQVQKERMENLEEIKEFKNELEALFPNYRFSARLKSLPSIFGKMLRHRTVADVYGMKIIVPTIADCYKLKEWFLKHNEQFAFKDKIANPKPNGYRDLKIVINYVVKSGETVLVEFIIQTPEMYVDSHTIQKHSNVYPWKYHDVIKNLPAEYEYVEF